MNRQAQENLGYCYYYGRNMPVDHKKAFHYFALGAFDGHLISLYKIGDMYQNGYYLYDKTLLFYYWKRRLQERSARNAFEIFEIIPPKDRKAKNNYFAFALRYQSSGH